jgi:DNA-binding LytR/AlgR family response regulator
MINKNLETWVESNMCFQLVGAQYIVLSPMEVLSLEADGQVCLLTLADGNRITAARHLGYYKAGLIQNFQFIEVSKSLLINVFHIVKYAPRERTIQLSSGQVVSVSKSKQEVLNKVFKDLHNLWEMNKLETINEDSGGL